MDPGWSLVRLRLDRTVHGARIEKFVLEAEAVPELIASVSDFSLILCGGEPREVDSPGITISSSERPGEMNYTSVLDMIEIGSD